MFRFMGGLLGVIVMNGLHVHMPRSARDGFEKSDFFRADWG